MAEGGYGQGRWLWCTGMGSMDEVSGPVAVSLIGGRLEGILSPRRSVRTIPEEMTYRGPLPHSNEGERATTAQQVQTRVYSRNRAGYIVTIFFEGDYEEE